MLVYLIIYLIPLSQTVLQVDPADHLRLENSFLVLRPGPSVSPPSFSKRPFVVQLQPKTAAELHLFLFGRGLDVLTPIAPPSTVQLRLSTVSPSNRVTDTNTANQTTQRHLMARVIYVRPHHRITPPRILPDYLTPISCGTDKGEDPL